MHVLHPGFISIIFIHVATASGQTFQAKRGSRRNAVFSTTSTERPKMDPTPRNQPPFNRTPEPTNRRINRHQTVAALPPQLYKCGGSPVRVVRSVPEEQYADQDKCRENDIPDKVHPMDALTATKAGVFILDIKTIPSIFHLVNQPRQRSSTVINNRVSPLRSNHPVNCNPMTELSFSLPHVRRAVRKSARSRRHPSRSPRDHTRQAPCKMSS